MKLRVDTERAAQRTTVHYFTVSWKPYETKCLDLLQRISSNQSMTCATAVAAMPAVGMIPTIFVEILPRDMPFHLVGAVSDSGTRRRSWQANTTWTAQENNQKVRSGWFTFVSASTLPKWKLSMFLNAGIELTMEPRAKLWKVSWRLANLSDRVSKLRSWLFS